MIRSMTGYGRGNYETDKFKLEIEIKSVNNRYSDFILKMPKKFLRFEDHIKGVLKGKINRGRIEVYFNYEEITSDNFTVIPNFEVLDKYYDAYKQISERYDINREISLSLLLKNDEALRVEFEEIDEDEILEVLNGALISALDSLIQMREREGKKLVEDILYRIDKVCKIVLEIEKMSPLILETHREKMKERIESVLEDGQLEESRLMQEVAIYADKTNITEEIVRLRSHFDQFKLILNSGGDVGRKLDFLVQELNREVNTIGSKSPDIDISNYVVDMKSEIEKIREQVQNLE